MHHPTKVLDFHLLPESCPFPFPALAVGKGLTSAYHPLRNRAQPSFYFLSCIHNAVHLYFIFKSALPCHDHDLRPYNKLEGDTDQPWCHVLVWDLRLFPAGTCFQLIPSRNTWATPAPPFLFPLSAASLLPSGHQWQLAMTLFKYSKAHFFSIPLTRTHDLCGACVFRTVPPCLSGTDGYG